LGQDPGEKHDLSDQHPDIVKRIAGYMEASHVESELYPTPRD
jgi:hypothetical protein